MSLGSRSTNWPVKSSAVTKRRRIGDEGVKGAVGHRAESGNTPIRMFGSRDSDTRWSICTAITEGSHSRQRIADSVSRNSKVFVLSCKYRLPFQLERHRSSDVAFAGTTGCSSRAHIFGHLQQPGDERGQKMPHQDCVGLQRRELALPMVQTSAHRSTHVLVLGVGDADERQQLMPDRAVHPRAVSICSTSTMLGSSRPVSMRLTCFWLIPARLASRSPDSPDARRSRARPRPSSADLGRNVRDRFSPFVFQPVFRERRGVLES